MSKPRVKRTAEELAAARFRRRINRGIVLPVGDIINGETYLRKSVVIAVMGYYGLEVR